MAGISAEGFTGKTREEIIDSLNQRFRDRFGSLFDTSPQTPDGQTVGILADILAEHWQLAELAYNSYVPSKTFGVGLDYITELNDVDRIQNQPSYATCVFEGTAGAIIPAGSRVSTTDGIQFQTKAEVTLSDSVVNTVTVEALEQGPIIVEAESIVNIDDPVLGWDSVINPTEGITGIVREEDAQLRARRVRTLASKGGSTYEATYSELSKLNIPFVRIVDNDTADPLPSGQPPKSYLTVVDGGAVAEIGQAIYDNKPAGIRAWGDIEVSAVDRHGFSHVVAFSRPVHVPIHVKVEFKRLPGAALGTDVLIQNALVEHLNAINIGIDVVWSELFVPAMSVSKYLSIKSLQIGFDGITYGEDDLTIDIVQKAVASAETVEVIDVDLAP